MFFLLRTAFWLGIVLALLPTFAGGDRAQQASERAEVSASAAVSAATATVSDLVNFCDRQPDACTVGAQAAVAFGEKAQAGAKIVYDYLTERTSPKSTGSVPAKPARKTADAGRDTLTAADRTPAWRKSAPHKEAQAGRAG